MYLINKLPVQTTRVQCHGGILGAKGKHAPGLPPPKPQMRKGAGVLMHMLPSVAG